jgi:hypothetical protein
MEMKGISVNRKIVAGRMAIRRLNAIDDARVTSTPFLKPLITNSKTSLIGIPSNPGRTRFFIFSFNLNFLSALMIRIN